MNKRIILVLLAVLLMAGAASATTLFQDNFNDGDCINNPIWSVSGVDCSSSIAVFSGESSITNQTNITRQSVNWSWNYNSTSSLGLYIFGVGSDYATGYTNSLNVYVDRSGSGYIRLDEWVGGVLVNEIEVAGSTYYDNNHSYKVVYNNNSKLVSLFVDNTDIANFTSIGNYNWSKITYYTLINDAGNIFIDNILIESPPLPPPIYDPSGYVNDTNGNPLHNAKVTLSNATWTDPCLSGCYTNTAGYWNTNIYTNGTYNYNVTLNGFTTLTGSQLFNMSGTNYNFTMTPKSARLYGTVYEWTNESGSKSIVGDLKSLKQIFKGLNKYKIYVGSTLTLKAPDTKTYVLKNKDVDISGDSANIGILESGSFIIDNQIIEENKDYRYKVSETTTTDLYLVLKIGTIFSGTGDTSFIEVTPSYDVRQKSIVSTWDLLYYWNTYFNSGIAGVSLFFIDVINWISFAPDKPDTKVTFNASTGNDAEAEMIMDFSSDTSLTTYSLTIRTANTGITGKVGYGFTDDDTETPPNYKDVLIQTGNNEYGTADYRKFSDTDTDGDKKIKVWLYFYSGYGSSWDFNYFVTAFCSGCNKKPLADATVYQSFNNNTKSNAIGFYNLFVPFGTYNISYSKDGYESKSISFTFDAGNNTNNTDVIINKSTTSVIEQAHYVKVLPNPSDQGTAINAYYKTLGTYSYYKISICPFNDDANCLDTYDSDYGVAPNKESSVALKMYPIGTYTVYLSGKAVLDWSWTIVAMNNFTIVSTIPTATWEASLYYLGDTMKINVYVPADSQNLTVYYPNGTLLFTGMFSAATTIQNKTFATNLNSTAGKYITEITGNTNKSITELLPISAANYSLSAPSSVTWGKSFTVQYVSPKTSELVILKSDGSPAYSSKTVSGSKSVTFNTSSLENKADTLTIKLIQNNIEKAKITISIGEKTSSDPSQATTNFWVNLLSFLGMPAFWGLLLFVSAIFVVATNEKAAPALGTTAFILANIEAVIGLWAPFTMYILLVTWIIAGITFTLGRKTTTGTG